MSDYAQYNGKRLEVAATVARLLSFTKAAEELHMTQPAVTFQVRQLEDFLNTRLFDRSHNPVALTDDGVRYQKYAEAQLAHAEEFLEYFDIDTEINF